MIHISVDTLNCGNVNYRYNDVVCTPVGLAHQFVVSIYRYSVVRHISYIHICRVNENVCPYFCGENPDFAYCYFINNTLVL